MPDPDDPAQAAAEALRAAGVEILPDGDDMDGWRIGDFRRSDLEVIRLAESRGLVEAEPIP